MAPIYSVKQDFYLEPLVKLARQIRQNTSGIVTLSTGALQWWNLKQFSVTKIRNVFCCSNLRFFFFNRNEPKSFESLIVKNKTTKPLDQTLFYFVQSL